MKIMKEKVVIALSGGMDSATLLAKYIHEFFEVHCLSFFYGSKHNQYELNAAKALTLHYQIKHHHFLDLKNIFNLFESNLLQSGGEIPEGHYTEESMSKTVVPGRNSIFLSIMLGYAQTIGASKIALGIHAGDHAIYPDCRKDFAGSFHMVVKEASERKINFEYPFINMNKQQILKLGYSFYRQVPYNKTRTCYKDQPIACGKCGSCVERLEAFSQIGMVDPLEYESNNEIRV